MRIKHEVSEPQVKQLVWEDEFDIASAIELDDKKDVLQYRISSIDNCGIKEISVYIGFEKIFSLNNVQNMQFARIEAKAYAHQHFERLIKSCLEGV